MIGTKAMIKIEAAIRTKAMIRYGNCDRNQNSDQMSYKGNDQKRG